MQGIAMVSVWKRLVVNWSSVGVLRSGLWNVAATGGGLAVACGDMCIVVICGDMRSACCD